jgi:hypothetical protein
MVKNMTDVFLGGLTYWVKCIEKNRYEWGRVWPVQFRIKPNVCWSKVQSLKLILVPISNFLS